jgi:hypothetical protein
LPAARKIGSISPSSFANIENANMQTENIPAMSNSPYRKIASFIANGLDSVLLSLLQLLLAFRPRPLQPPSTTWHRT